MGVIIIMNEINENIEYTNYTGYATFVIEIYGCYILWSSLIDITSDNYIPNGLKV